MNKQHRARTIAGVLGSGALLVCLGALGLIGCGSSNLTSSTTTAEHDAHFTYKGETGPEHWGMLSHDWEACETGTKQSPINLTNPTTNAALPLLDFSNYHATPLKAKNNGHSIETEYESGSMLHYDGHDYNVLQFHFHSPSEHTEGGKAYNGEMHIVHQLSSKASAGTTELLVVGVFLRDGAENSVLQNVWDLMPTTEGENAGLGTINVKDLLPANTGPYYHYTGSLTTPPCTESVHNWIVLQQPIEWSQAQRQKFLDVIGENARPVQPLNGRTIEIRQ